MMISKVTVFCKLPDCPSAETLLDYSKSALNIEPEKTVENHLNVCDFCAAELQLLTGYPSSESGNVPKIEMPMHLRLLAESVLFGACHLDFRADNEQVTLSDA